MKWLLPILLLFAGCNMPVAQDLPPNSYIYTDGWYLPPGAETALLIPDPSTRVLMFFDSAIPLLNYVVVDRETWDWLREQAKR